MKKMGNKKKDVKGEKRNYIVIYRTKTKPIKK